MEQEDLFESISDLPQEIQDILAKYNDGDFTYENCQNLEAELKPFGYTFDYGLTAEPFNLRKIPMKKISFEDLSKIFSYTNIFLVDGIPCFAGINKRFESIEYSTYEGREEIDLIKEIKLINDPTWGASIEIFSMGISDSFILTPLFAEKNVEELKGWLW